MKDEETFDPEVYRKRFQMFSIDKYGVKHLMKIETEIDEDQRFSKLT